MSAQDNFCKEHGGNKRWGRLLKQGDTGKCLYLGCLLSLLVLKEEPGRKSTYYNLSISTWEYILDSSYGTALLNHNLCSWFKDIIFGYHSISSWFQKYNFNGEKISPVVLANSRHMLEARSSAPGKRHRLLLQKK